VETIEERTAKKRQGSDLEIVAINKGHVRAYIDALQDAPLGRTRSLRELTLAEVSAWRAEHPEAPRPERSSINKSLAMLQAVVSWAALKGAMVPDDVRWSDPFSRQRLEEDDPERGPFSVEELQAIFALLPTLKERRGASGFWLPVLAFYTGARQGELAGLTVENIDTNTFPGHPIMVIERERDRGKSTKNKRTQRAVPIHRELIRIGFLDYTQAIRSKRGTKAWLFPDVAPDNQNDAIGAWSTFFHDQIRPSIPDKNKVFHSFRHGMNDALIVAGVQEDVRNALLGWVQRGMSGRRYGVNEVVAKFGIEQLEESINKARLPTIMIAPYAEQ
jgi:integrase